MSGREKYCELRASDSLLSQEVVGDVKQPSNLSKMLRRVGFDQIFPHLQAHVAHHAQRSGITPTPAMLIGEEIGRLQGKVS
eukprot:1352894-Amorphochlora_amoeboformis.AAC.1